MARFGNILSLLGAASLGAVAGAGAQALISKIPMAQNIPILGTAAGFGVSYIIGKKIGKGKNAGMAGIIGFAITTGALQAITGGLTAQSTAGGLF